MPEALVVGPGVAHARDQSIGIIVDQVRISGDLAPPVFDRGQVFDTIVLDRLEQSLEPLGPCPMVRRRSGQDRDQLVQCAGNRRTQGARRGVDALECRPDALHQGDYAVTCRDGVRFGHRLDLGNRFLEPADGEGGTAPAIGLGAEPRLEFPLRARRHRSWSTCSHRIGMVRGQRLRRDSDAAGGPSHIRSRGECRRQHR